MRRNPQNSPAIVLRQRNYGESDLIVEVLTAEHGLLRGFARSARKSVKRFGAALGPYSSIELRWQPGRGDLLHLVDADLLDARQGLRQSLDHLALAGYGVELLEMLVQAGESQPQIYTLLEGYLDYLSNAGDVRLARLLFELRLVQHLGYIPHLLHCSECFEQFDLDRVAFDPARGGSLCESCAAGEGMLRVGVGTLGSLSRTLQTPIGLFEGFHLGDQTLNEGAAVMAGVLSPILPRHPKSLQFLQQARGFSEP